MSTRKIQDETEARKHTAKWRESGLTLGAWAHSLGINGRSLHAWNVNLSRGNSNTARKAPKARKAPNIKLVELIPIPTDVRSARYAAKVGQFALDVDAHFEEVTLRRPIGLLRSC